jgi:hypothetical protein
MSFWQTATEGQLKVIEHFCRGKELLDLGGLDGSLSYRLLEAGAATAVTVDKEKVPSLRHPRMTVINQPFSEFFRANQAKQWQTAILSWPANNDYAVGQMLPILDHCREVVYLGSNSNGSQCGTPLLWLQLVRRQIHCSLVEKKATLIVYTDILEQRYLIDEERLGLGLEERLGWFCAKQQGRRAEAEGRRAEAG